MGLHGEEFWFSHCLQCADSLSRIFLQVAFDVYAIIFVIINVFHRPHKLNHGVQLLDNLNRDGAIFNLVRIFD